MTDSHGVEEEADEGLEELSQTEAAHALAPPKAFAAWHHPRKQFVRIQQWRAEVHKLILELPEQPARLICDPVKHIGIGLPTHYSSYPSSAQLAPFR